MKKVSLLLTVILVVGILAGNALAAQPVEEPDPISESEAAGVKEEEKPAWNLKYTGLYIEVPEEYQNAKGTIVYSGGREIRTGAGVYITEFLYIPMEIQDYRALSARTDLTQEEVDEFQDSVLELVGFAVVDQGRDKSVLREYLPDFGDVIDSMVEIAKTGEYTLYMFRMEPEEKSDLGEFWEEFQELYSKPELLTDNLLFSEPVPMEEAVQGTISFTTTDIYGNEITSQDIFGNHKITMVNIWTTWCPYCIKEMPDLERLSKEFEEEGCAIIGLLYDGTGDAEIAEGQEILEDTGVTYVNLLPWEGYQEMFPVQAFPTSVFVDSQGNIVGQAVVGSYVEEYGVHLAQALEAIDE